jgi:hypothetical protein
MADQRRKELQLAAHQDTIGASVKWIAPGAGAERKRYCSKLWCAVIPSAWYE